MMHYLLQGRTVDLSVETVEARKKWYNIFKVLIEKNNFSRILCPAKVSFKNKVKSRHSQRKENEKVLLLVNLYSNTHPHPHPHMKFFRQKGKDTRRKLGISGIKKE